MKKKEQNGAGLATQLRESAPGAFGLTGAAALGGSEAEIYRAMRENVPILDAAIGKLVRLTGGFTVTCGDRTAEKGLRQFLKTVPVGHAQYGLECFLQTYLDCMLTYGRAVGEMIVADGRQPGYSDGMTLPELQNLMVQYGAQVALNLDGGGSTELWFSGQILNSPCGGHERRLSDIICF